MLNGLFLSFFGGWLLGFLGIGSGVVMVPIMCYTLGFLIHFAL